MRLLNVVNNIVMSMKNLLPKKVDRTEELIKEIKRAIENNDKSRGDVSFFTTEKDLRF